MSLLWLAICSWILRIIGSLTFYWLSGGTPPILIILSPLIIMFAKRWKSEICAQQFLGKFVQKRGLFGTPKTVRALSPGSIYFGLEGVFGTFLITP